MRKLSVFIGSIESKRKFRLFWDTDPVPVKSHEKRLTKKLVEVIEYLALDMNVPDIVGHTGLSYKAVEKRIARAKDFYTVKYAHGLVAEAEHRGHINVRQLKRKRKR